MKVNKEEDEDEERLTVSRRRRSDGSYQLVALTRDGRISIDQYLDWRRTYGYGRSIHRWGK